MNHHDSLLDRIDSREATVGIIGLGYVGLPLADALHGGGLRVVGFDIDERKIEDLAAGRSYLKHLGSEMTERLAASERFEATADFSRLGEVEAVLVCVPTPLGPHQEPDLSFVADSARRIAASGRDGQLVVLESTTFPGTTRGVFLSTLRDEGPDPPRALFVAFSPEREDPGSKSHVTRAIPKLVGGIDAASTELAARLYRTGFEEVVEVSSAEVAEAAKLLENVFRSVNIALVNELKLILSAMDIDVWEVIEAAATKPFGFMKFLPGPGLGGHCIPIDPFYLAWRARECGQPTRFIELAGEINSRMPAHVVDRVAEALNGAGKPLKDARVLVIGLAYKANVDDSRESPAAEILELLEERGAAASYHDPHIPTFPRMRRHRFDLASVELTESVLAASDCIVVVTDHEAVDWSLVGRTAALIVDTRNVMAGVDGVRARVLKA
ncbi:MAG: nucleotide sugar dehydrogenase [Planctomycetota bacterium]|jgi:UDP-N-acetyl-D-glucosamine dehydrogenase|nr:nucleotide sugar dehydrogenase [Planctomycetota bacterium]